MQIQIVLRRLMAIVAFLAMVVGPVASSAAGVVQSAPAVSMAQEVTGQFAGIAANMAMDHAMPCCPDQAPADDCKSCPMAICMAQVLQCPSLADIVTPAPFVLAGLILPSNDSARPSLSSAPPPRPPQS